jgi:hypothetical protein
MPAGAETSDARTTLSMRCYNLSFSDTHRGQIVIMSNSHGLTTEQAGEKQTSTPAELDIPIEIKKKGVVEWGIRV